MNHLRVRQAGHSVCPQAHTTPLHSGPPGPPALQASLSLYVKSQDYQDQNGPLQQAFSQVSEYKLLSVAYLLSKSHISEISHVLLSEEEILLQLSIKQPKHKLRGCSTFVTVGGKLT